MTSTAVSAGPATSIPMAGALLKRSASEIDEPPSKRARNETQLGDSPGTLSQLNNPNDVRRVWAEHRAALCDALPYYRAHQGSLYTMHRTVHGVFLDSAGGQTDTITSQVVITTIGGGLVRSASGDMVRTAHQTRTEGNVLRCLQTQQRNHALVVIVGKRNQSVKVPREHYYNVLDYFHITDIWAEPNANGFREFKIRYEKVDLRTESWWEPQSQRGQFERVWAGRITCSTRTCHSCGNESKEIFKQGWTCLTELCSQYFVFANGFQGTPTYADTFLAMRTPYTGRAPSTLIPTLPTLAPGQLGTEAEFKRGIVCPKCGRCSRRKLWTVWHCESETCDFVHLTPMNVAPLTLIRQEAANLFRRKGKKVCIIHESIHMYETSVPGYCMKTMNLLGEPNNDGNREVIGTISVLSPTESTRVRSGGVDDLFSQTYESAPMMGLERHPARCRGSRIEELTSHFARNFGSDYKFGVAHDSSTSFEDAPDPVMEGLGRLTWAAQLVVDDVTVRNAERSVSKESMPAAFLPFNEELILGYFEGSAISYHDDGEKDVGPTVATLSLGSPAVMSFRPKRGKNIGPLSSIDSKGRAAMLSFVVEHGDIVVMHGSLIHRLYEHKVDPAGLVRFAMTCRHIHTDNMKDEKRRVQAVSKGLIPSRWNARLYQGEPVAQDTDSDTVKSDSEA